MPVIKSAKKKLRQDVKRRRFNLSSLTKVKEAVKLFKAKKDPKLLPALYKALDMAVKKNIFHRNKAARLKSRLSSLLTTS